MTQFFLFPQHTERDDQVWKKSKKEKKRCGTKFGHSMGSSTPKKEEN
jgi:hypothetical protein